MTFQENFSLLKFNTFGIDANCKYFFEYHNIGELKEAINKTKDLQVEMYHIGGGSNLLFTKDFDGAILHAATKDIKVVEETDEYAYVEADAGVVWDTFVDWTITHGYYGLENLSLIPGEVGASAVQNIGAYGIEACRFIYKVKTIEFETGNELEFNNTDCQYDYRYSIFKGTLKGKCIITSVVFKLPKTFTPYLEYGALKALVAENNQTPEGITASTLRRLIINIRNAKLPNPEEIGSAGSFFMNPIVNKEVYQALSKQHPNMPHYPAPNGVKLSAGWLIDKAGWRGIKIGHSGVYEKQALVLVNHGGATGREIVELAKSIQKDIHEKFGINIYPEVIYL